jgi:hypothetical protein
VSCEISNKSVYEQRYSKPVWPGGISGVTIGIGYDLGFVTPDLLRSDWANIIDDERLMTLRRVCGVRGPVAEHRVPSVSGVTVTWNEAVRQFAIEIHLVAWISRVDAVIAGASRSYAMRT